MPILAELICAQVDLDVTSLDHGGNARAAQAVRLRPRRSGGERALGSISAALRNGQLW